MLIGRCRPLLSHYFSPSHSLYPNNKTPNMDQSLKSRPIWRRGLLQDAWENFKCSVRQIFLLFSGEANPAPLLLPQGYNKHQQRSDAYAAPPHPLSGPVYSNSTIHKATNGRDCAPVWHWHVDSITCVYATCCTVAASAWRKRGWNSIPMHKSVLHHSMY